MWTLCGHCILLGHVLYLDRAPCTKETLPDFLLVVSGDPTSTIIQQVDGLSTDPRVLGHHSEYEEGWVVALRSIFGNIY